MAKQRVSKNRLNLMLATVGLETRLSKHGEEEVLLELRDARAKIKQLQQDVDSKGEILERCLRVIDPTDDGKRSKMAAGVAPCKLYGALPGEFKKLHGVVARLRSLAFDMQDYFCSGITDDDRHRELMERVNAEAELEEAAKGGE